MFCKTLRKFFSTNAVIENKPLILIFFKLFKEELQVALRILKSPDEG